VDLERIRVWLEPGYDYGRYGAWMLDWPGCFVWDESRDAVLGRVPESVRRHTEWLAAFGEPVVVPAGSGLEVVEEVSSLVKDGYERNAIFMADRRPVAVDELAAMFRQLGFARADMARHLDSALGRAATRPGGSPRDARDPDALARGAAPARETDGVLRHIAGAEIWLASRLDRALRFEGAPRDGDLAAYLDESRAWMVDQLGALHARDPALEATDGKGEEWTLAKVLRRALYHSLDHLAELEARHPRSI